MVTGLDFLYLTIRGGPGWVRPRKATACASGAEAFAEFDAAHAAANPAGV